MIPSEKILQLRKYVPYLVFAFAWNAFDLGGLNEIEFFICVFVTGSLGVFWELSADDETKSFGKFELHKMISLSWYGGIIASMMLGLSIMLIGFLIAEIWNLLVSII